MESTAYYFYDDEDTFELMVNELDNRDIDNDWRVEEA